MKKIIIGLVISLLTLNSCSKNEYEEPKPIAPSALLGTWQTEDEKFQITFNDGEFYHQFSYGWNFLVIKTDELGNKTYHSGDYYLVDIYNEYAHIPPYIRWFNNGRFICFHEISFHESFHFYKKFTIIDKDTIIISNEIEEIENLESYKYENDLFENDVVVLKKVYIEYE